MARAFSLRRQVEGLHAKVPVYGTRIYEFWQTPFLPLPRSTLATKNSSYFHPFFRALSGTAIISFGTGVAE